MTACGACSVGSGSTVVRGCSPSDGDGDRPEFTSVHDCKVPKSWLESLLGFSGELGSIMAAGLDATAQRACIAWAEARLDVSPHILSGQG